MAKGGQFERDFSRQLSLWWTKGERDDCFWRTSNSGGRATVRARLGKKTSGHCGDIGSTDEVGRPFTNLITLELKRGYSAHTVADLMDKGPKAAKQEFEKWISQAIAAAERAETKYWMIVQRRDQRVPLVFFSERLELALQVGAIGCPRLVLWTIIDGKYVCIHGCRLEEFLKDISPEHIKRLG